MSETEREMSTRERFFKKLIESVEGKKDNHYNIITKCAYDSLLKEVNLCSIKKDQAIQCFGIWRYKKAGNPRRASQILFADGRHF